MYQIQMRFYVLNGRVHSSAEYSSDYRGNSESLAVASFGTDRTGFSTEDNHVDILHAAQVLLSGIAQDLDHPLF